LLRLLRSTWRVELVDPGRVAELAGSGRRQSIVALWHQALLTLMCCYRGLPFCVPVSEHRDGEYVAQVMERYGFLAVRGSSTRGGVRLLRKLLAAMGEGWSCAITPDGPQGPRFSVHPGFIALARRSGLPVHPLGVAVRGAWVTRSWDAFTIPKPRARIVVIVADPMPADLMAGGSTAELCKALKDEMARAAERARARLGQ